MYTNHYICCYETKPLLKKAALKGKLQEKCALLQRFLMLWEHVSAYEQHTILGAPHVFADFSLILDRTLLHLQATALFTSCYGFLLFQTNFTVYFVAYRYLKAGPRCMAAINSFWHLEGETYSARNSWWSKEIMHYYLYHFSASY